MDIVAAFDNDAAAVDTFNRNFGPVASVLDVTSNGFGATLSRLGSVDVVTGGFPCQGFSKAGPKRENDPRNALYRAMLMAVQILRPEVFIAENVDGLKQNFNGTYVDAISHDFRRLGYAVHHTILDAVGFGVPQHRRRIFFVGSRSSTNWTWPAYTHAFTTRNGERDYDGGLFARRERQQLPPVTIRDVIYDLTASGHDVADHEWGSWSEDDATIMRRIGPGQKLCNVRFSPTSVFTWQIPEVFGTVTSRETSILSAIAKNRRHKRYGSVPNGNPLDVHVIEQLSGLKGIRKDLERLATKGYVKWIDDKVDLKGALFCSGLYKRPLWDEPAPTILTNFHDPRYFIHPALDRPFSVRECARLQGFPDSFLFCGTVIQKYRQIGNAVPPPMAKAIADQVVKIHFASRYLLRPHRSTAVPSLHEVKERAIA